jgi:hypothetical protein
MKRITRLILIAIAATLTVISLLSKPAISKSACTQGCPSSKLNPDLVHGMRIVGDNSVYITHKPFLNTPSEAHNFQAIYEVDLVGLTNNDSANPQEIYLSDQSQNSLNEYTLMPTQAFTKTELLNGSIKSFKGQIYRGDIEECLRKKSRGTKLCPIALIPGNPEVEVKIKKQVFVCDFADSNCLTKNAMRSALALPIANLEYLLFGNDSEQYLAHRITGAPDGDFDQILRVAQTIELNPEQVTKLNQNNYLKLVATDNLSNTRKNAIRSGSMREASFLIDNQGEPVNLTVDKDAEYYFETDPNIF